MYKELFSDRHNSINTQENQKMLSILGYDQMEQLISDTIPDEIRLQNDLELDEPLTEVELLAKLKSIGEKNQVSKNYIGMGYYGTHTPKVILRNILENPGWYTQYTPYQAEIAQGRLEALLNFQTMVMDLTGMEIANASLLDEATAAAEAMAMVFSAKSKQNGNKFFVSDKAFPQIVDVIETRAEPLGIKVIKGNPTDFEFNEEFFGLIVQYPNGEGAVEDYATLVERALTKNVKTIVAADILSLTLLEAPGTWGAEVVVGSTQRFGIPMGNGGPHAAYFATKEKYKRRLPGRVIGVSQDSNGDTALRMALQTREQHIKRDKATSNICTAQALLAVMAGMYAAYHGPKRLKQIASKVNHLTSILANNLVKIGFDLKNNSAFDTLAILLDENEQSKLKNILAQHKINLRYELKFVGISLDETAELNDVKLLIDLFAELKDVKVSFEQKVSQMWDLNLDRNTPYLEHPVFNSYHTEHEMLRYLKSLENKDLSLAHSMIALGSCTMKLNATTEMIPVTWESFGNIHPFAPKEQLVGYNELLNDLERDLSEITGFHKVSLQPNAGAQGEYAGLMTIREYFKDTNQHHRNIVIIPESAHGTNPASAVMAGMKVVVVKCHENGYINLTDLREKVELHKDILAAAMITYPSTNGVYEETIKEVTSLIHEFGGKFTWMELI